MIRYSVRSRYLVDVINDVKSGKLVLAPYFQRKLVWRESHKADFIETLLLRYPIPEIFVARGTIDVDSMTSTSCVVDGQQRLNAIREYIDGRLVVRGGLYADLTPQEKEALLKYEIPIIDLDLSHDDPQIIEIFKRLNRTYYALSTIEKNASEYASSDFMLVAKLICGELRNEEDTINVDPKLVVDDPNVSEAFSIWANGQTIRSYSKLILETEIFTKYEISRMVHLAFTLNVMATVLTGYYNRNDKVAVFLDLYKDEVPGKDQLIARLNKAARCALKLGVLKGKFWTAKSNVFSLIVTLAENVDGLDNIDHKALAIQLSDFGKNVPPEYALAAREGVNNLAERTRRGVFLSALVEAVLSGPSQHKTSASNS